MTASDHAGLGRRLAVSAGIFVITFATLTVAWPLFAGPFGAAFRLGGAMMAPSFEGNATIRFQPLPEPERYADTRVTIYNKGNGYTNRMGLSARYLGYAPLSLFIALVLATPLSWRRRGIAMAWGVPVVAIFVCLRVVLHVREGSAEIDIIELGRLTKLLSGAVSRSTFTWYVMPIVVWMLVAFRRGDWVGIAQSAP